ncbi:MAG: hypothetical protein ABI859_12680 [Pseudomonadota bacterium]
MGSAFSLFVGLALTLVVFLSLSEYRERLQGEQGPLLAGIAWAGLLTLASTAAFLGEVRQRAWRRPAQLAVLLVLLGMAWVYWPRG